MKRWALALYLASVSALAQSGNLAISSPASGSTVSGAVVLSLEPGQASVPARIQYILNGRPLGPQLTQPHRYTWATSSIWDGPASLRAEGRAADGSTVSTPEILVTVSNKSGVIRTLSPDLTLPLSGTIEWKVTGSRPIAPDEVPELISRGYSASAAVEAFMFFVDGRLLKLRFTGNTGVFDLDTTQFSNGPHELFVGAYSSARGAPPLAMQQTRVIFENGRTRQELRPRWREVFLSPGQSMPLDAQWIYTNGEAEPAAAPELEASSSAPEVVSVRDGQIVAGAPGVANLTITSAGRSATFRVQVDNQPGLPHFSRSGEILTRYEAGRSFFVRSMFNLSTTELERAPGLADLVRAAGINTLTNSVYSNPADNHNPDYATWVKGWDANWNKTEDVARRNQMSLLLFGDDIARTPAELADSIQNPWAVDAIQHALTRARDSGLAVGVEMVDEVTFAWGGTPKPADERWRNRNPPLPADSFLRLMTILNGASRPPLSWPVAGLASNTDAGNWMGDPQFSDYASLFWDKLDWRVAYPAGPSLPQVQAGQERATIGRFSVLQRTKPMLMLMSVTGPFYIKQGPGEEFVPGQDQFQTAGSIRPELCSAQAMLAVAAGMAGVRAYAFDSPAWKNTRSRARIGQGNLQTGAEPLRTGTDRWQAMSAAFNLIQKLEPHLLQPRINALNLGANFVTAAREGPRSRLFMAVNFSESDETVTLDFTSYRFADAPRVKFYRLLGGSSSSQTVSNDERGALRIRSGETVIWLFQPAEEASAMTPSVAIVAPEDVALAPSPVTFEAWVEDDTQLDWIDLLVDGRLVDSSSSRQFTWDPSQEPAGTWHSVALVAHFLNGESSEARIAVWLAPPDPV